MEIPIVCPAPARIAGLRLKKKKKEGTPLSLFFVLVIPPQKILKNGQVYSPSLPFCFVGEGFTDWSQ